MIEEWKDIPGYEGIYEASNLGRIRTADGKTTVNSIGHIRHWKQRILKTKKRHNVGRPPGIKEEYVTLYKDGKPKSFKVARLVALAWCDGYKDGMTVNHIDCDPTNNHADNLEWLTNLENVRHAIRNGIYDAHYKPVTILVNGEKVSFPTMKAASLALGKHEYYVYGKLKTKRGRKELGVDG